MIPFDGSIPFDCVAKQIEESGYTGTLMLEAFLQSKDGKYIIYRDYTLEQYISRAAAAAKKLCDMIDG